MSSLTVRLKPETLQSLRHRAQVEGVTLSELVRRLVFEASDLETHERLEDHERRLGRLEGMAGL